MIRFITDFFKTLAKGLLLFVAIIGGIVFILWEKGRESNDWEAANHASSTVVSKISNAELQSLVADVYHAESSRFIQPDLLWVTLPVGVDVQKTCQAIANVWAHRSGLGYVRVESWRGTQRLGQGTVYDGQPVRP
jgi:hypothetical protein